MKKKNQEDRVSQKSSAKGAFGLDHIMMATGALLMVVILVTLAVFLQAQSVKAGMVRVASAGEGLASMGLVGEKGMVTISEDLLASWMNPQEETTEDELEEEIPEEIEEPEEEEEEEELDPETTTVSVSFSSVDKDLKIRFVNMDKNKLLTGYAFEVTITTPSNKTLIVTDEDKDGIIYLTELEAGEYSILISSLFGFDFPAATQKVTVKSTIEYVVINDIVKEIKEETAETVVKEDANATGTQAQVVVEATLKDTVTYLASTSKRGGNTDGYTVISVAERTTLIPDPLVVKAAGGNAAYKFTAAIDPPAADPPAADPPAGSTYTEGTYYAPGSQVTTSYSFTEPVAEGETVGSAGSGSVKTRREITARTMTYSLLDGATGTLSVTSEAVSTPSGSVTLSIPSDTTLSQMSVQASYVVTYDVYTASPSVDIDGNPVLDGDGNAVYDEYVKTQEAVQTTAVTATKVVLIKQPSALVFVTAPAGESISTDVNSPTQVTVGTPFTYGLKINYNDGTSGSLLTGDAIAGAGITLSVDAGASGIVSISSTEITALAGGDGVYYATATRATGNLSATIPLKVYVHPKDDTTTKLLDNFGKPVYIYKADEKKYVEATWSDYYKDQNLYIVAGMLYTGWQTIENKTYYFDANSKAVTGEQVIQGVKYNFAADGVLSLGNKVIGIDISKYQGAINWTAVKNSGVTFAIIRCGYRGYTVGGIFTDSTFQSNIKAAAAAGIKVGAYFFSQAITEAEAIEEASACVALVKSAGVSLAYPIFIDTEYANSSKTGRADSLTKAERTAICKAFCRTVASAGYKAGVYANKDFMTNKLTMSELSAYTLWIAQYNTSVTYTGRYDMWQYTSKGTVGGITGNVDMNYSYVNY